MAGGAMQGLSNPCCLRAIGSQKPARTNCKNVLKNGFAAAQKSFSFDLLLVGQFS